MLYHFNKLQREREGKMQCRIKCEGEAPELVKVFFNQKGIEITERKENKKLVYDIRERIYANNQKCFS
jgi:hypothetical protein